MVRVYRAHVQELVAGEAERGPRRRLRQLRRSCPVYREGRARVQAEWLLRHRRESSLVAAVVLRAAQPRTPPRWGRVRRPRFLRVRDGVQETDDASRYSARVARHRHSMPLLGAARDRQWKSLPPRRRWAESVVLEGHPRGEVPAAALLESGAPCCWRCWCRLLPRCGRAKGRPALAAAAMRRHWLRPRAGHARRTCGCRGT